jgi:hypothetical protein
LPPRFERKREVARVPALTALEACDLTQ